MSFTYKSISNFNFKPIAFPLYLSYYLESVKVKPIRLQELKGFSSNESCLWKGRGTSLVPALSFLLLLMNAVRPLGEIWLGRKA